jgi:shikimate dehydrogenase
MPSSAVQPLLALLAYPVGGNPTQYLVERACAKHDLDWRYLTFEVPPESLEDAIRGLRALGFGGAHCAAPHKQAVIPLLNRVTETAAAVGSVNLIYRENDGLVGDNTEGRGAVNAITGACDPAGKHVVLLGAGQLARAIAIELAGRKPASLTIVNRTESKAVDLASLLLSKFAVAAAPVAWSGDYVVPAEAELLINATSIGHTEDAPLPLTIDSLRPDVCIADAAWNVLETPLLAEARAKGCKTVVGLSMFIEQVAIALKLWTGVEPNREAMREAAEEFLEL